MSTPTSPVIHAYLFFQGNCQEAFEFYQTVLGGELTLMRYKDAPPMPEDAAECGPGPMKPGYEEMVMHASLQIGPALLMASDDCIGDDRIAGVSISLGYDDPEDVRRVFDGLSEGGQVEMPLAPTFWSPLFGCFKDRFGVAWMVAQNQCALEK